MFSIIKRSSFLSELTAAVCTKKLRFFKLDRFTTMGKMSFIMEWSKLKKNYSNYITNTITIRSIYGANPKNNCKQI
jgi:hypothetical protein